MTTEVAQSFTDLRFSSHLISFLADDVIVQRYVEIEGQMRNVMNVVKMRGSDHSKELRLYDVTEHGLAVGGALHDYRGIITGVAQRYHSSESSEAGMPRRRWDDTRRGWWWMLRSRISRGVINGGAQRYHRTEAGTR